MSLLSTVSFIFLPPSIFFKPFFRVSFVEENVMQQSLLLLLYRPDQTKVYKMIFSICFAFTRVQYGPLLVFTLH